MADVRADVFSAPSEMFFKHSGKRGDHKGGYSSCDEKDNLPLLYLPLHAGNGTAPDLSAMTSQEATDIYTAAFYECLMEGDDPTSVGGKKTQYEDTPAFPNGSILHFVPAGHVQSMDPTGMGKDHGFIAGVIKNIGDQPYPGGSNLIAPGEFVFLWIGRGSDGVGYSALLRLPYFPKDKNGSIDRGDITMPWWGTLCAKSHGAYPSPYARFKDPNGGGPCLALSGGKKGPHTPVDPPDGTWVDCSPGCCVAGGLNFTDKGITGGTLVPARTRRS